MATVKQDNWSVFPDKFLSVSGKIVNPSNGYPLSSMIISVLAIIEKTDSRSSSRQRKKQILSSVKDISDSYGRYSLLFKPDNLFLQMSKQDKKISYLLRISNDTTKRPVTEYPIDLQSNNEDVTLNVPIESSSISRRIWKDVATGMREDRLIKINELVRELNGVTPKQMLFGHLSIETRQSIITEVDKFFLDPNGLLNKISEMPGFHKLRDYKDLKQYSDKSDSQDAETRSFKCG